MLDELLASGLDAPTAKRVVASAIDKEMGGYRTTSSFDETDLRLTREMRDAVLAGLQ
jgi:hypothetical protein